MPVWEGKGRFLDLLKADKEIARLLTPEQLEAQFDDAYHTKHVDTIFKRVFGTA
jgi:adenylosuccinate lyase